MKIKSIFIASAMVIIISSLIHFLVPNSLELMALSGAKFLAGEFWRILTFSFTHLNANHLFENIIALGIVSVLGYEFGLHGKQFLVYFAATSIIVALTDIFLFPLLVIAGASLGTYGVLGALSIKGSNFMPKKYLIPLLGLSIFIKSFLSMISCQSCNTDLGQSLFHFSGFVTGIFLVYIPRFKNKKYSTIKNR